MSEEPIDLSKDTSVNLSVDLTLIPEPQLITPEVEPMAAKLGDQYDECLLGATVRGNFAYSLKRMIDFEVRHRHITADEAREIIGRDIIKIMQTHGSLSPEFIDDELMVEPVRIIIPN
jgi:hypothetical protein